MCLPVLGAVVGLVGSVVSGVAAAGQMKAQQESLNAQSKLQERQAEINTKTGDYEAERVVDVVKRTTGAQRAGFAANGLGLQGSAADVIADTAQEGALDVAAIKWNSALKADNLKYESKITKMNADSAGRAAGLAFIAPVLGGVAKFAGSFG